MESLCLLMETFLLLEIRPLGTQSTGLQRKEANILLIGTRGNSKLFSSHFHSYFCICEQWLQGKQHDMLDSNSEHMQPLRETHTSLVRFYLLVGTKLNLENGQFTHLILISSKNSLMKISRIMFDHIVWSLWFSHVDKINHHSECNSFTS